MAWMATAAAVTAMTLAVAPGARAFDDDGIRGTAEVSGEVQLSVTPAPWAALNGEGEGTARLEVLERTASDAATDGDLARFRAQIRLGDHRLELTLEDAGRTTAGSGDASEKEAARGAAGGVALDGYWTGPVTQEERWGTRAADVLAWGTARVTLDGRELTDAATLELAAFAPTGEEGGQLHVIVRDVPELSVIRVRFPEGVRLELSRPADGDGAVAARPSGAEEEGPEVLRSGEGLIPDEGPIPEDALERHVVMGTVPGPMVIEIEVEEAPAVEGAGTGGSGEADPRDAGGAAGETPEAGTGGSGAVGEGPTQEQPGQEPAMQQDAQAPRTAQQEEAQLGRAPTPDADVRLPEGAGGSGTPGLPEARFPEGTGDRRVDGRIEGIPPSNTQTGADRVEVLQDGATPVDRGTDPLSGIAPLNTAPAAPEARVLSPGIAPLSAEIPVSSTGLPPGSETNDGVLQSTVHFGPGAGGATRFGPGVGGGPTEAQLESQRAQEQAQGTVRPLGTLEDVPEMPAPIPPMNTAPAAPLPQGIQPLNAHPASPPR